MSEVATTNNKAPAVMTIKEFLAAPAIQKRIKEMLDDRASDFTTSVISLAGQDPKVMECEPRSLFNACLTAASMRLPVSKELGMAHIIPYKNNKLSKVEAQLQLGWRAYVQMAQRSGEYLTIAAAPVYRGQLVSSDPLRGNVYDFRPEAKLSDDVLGYASLFILRNGFEKDMFMTVEELMQHGKRYSQSFKSNYGPWVDNFDAMAKKTVLKLLIKNFGPMSIDMAKAVNVDQAVVKDDGSLDFIDGEEASKLEDEKATDTELDAIANAKKVFSEPVEAETVDPEQQSLVEEDKPSDNNPRRRTGK
jgi:recombination protein RecT